jgi:hypothetical protein
MGYPMRFRDGIYACASEQYVTIPDVGVRGPYAAGVPPIVRMPSGRKGIQIEESISNSQIRSRRPDLWSQFKTPIYAAGVADPVGGTTAMTIQDDNATEQEGPYSSAFVTAGIRVVFLAYAKYVDYRYFALDKPSGTEVVGIYDLIGNVAGGLPGYIPDALGLVNLGPWKLCWLTKDVAVNPMTPYVFGTWATDMTHVAGSAMGTTAVWEIMIATANYIPSIITTAAGVVTRAKSELYFPAAKIPAMLRKRFSCDITPYWSDAMPIAPRYLWSFADSTETISCYFNNADKKIKVVGSVTGLFVQSAALTLTPFTTYACSWDADTGKQTIAGVEVTGTAWATANGNLYWGMKNDLSGQFNGIISEPVIAWA